MEPATMIQYPPIQVVDENDEPVRGAPLDEIHREGLYFRVVHIFVGDGQGNILLQKRGPQMAVQPNHWDYAAAGHVDSGESYEFAAARELEEELGLRGFKLESLGKYFKSIAMDGRKLNHFTMVFKVVVPRRTPLTIAKDEVSAVKWVDRAALQRLVNEQPDQFTYYFLEGLKRYADKL